MAYSDAGSKSMVLVVVVIGISASLFIALTTTNFPILPNANGTLTTTTISPPIEKVSHEPIRIIGDEDFAAQAITESWPGTGSKETPYIIQGLKIDSEESCIRIEDVTVHFQIRYCTLTGGTIWEHAGVYLINTDNAYLFNCTIFVETAGILMEGANSCVVDCCDIEGATIGANVTYSTNSTFIFNHIIDNLIPVGVFFSDNITLQENVFYGSDMELGVFECTNVKIHGNILRDSVRGIVFGCIGGMISDNIIAYNSEYGLRLCVGSSGVQVIMNLFGFNGATNAADYGSENMWYDGNSSGNYWSDYDGEGQYSIPGSAGSIDPYPQMLTEEMLSELLV
ncbi:MAG: hypothetical protein EAX95_12745 [Candidatus Thorarchaeota archaeon]|nr:hypothetical protein [Candidatus Thorarchaeota archaeon]